MDNLSRQGAKAVPMFQRRGDYGVLRSVLDQAGYADEAVEESKEANYLFIRTRDLPALLYNTRHKTPFHILIRLFLMELPVKAEELEEVIKPMSLEQWLEAGLVRRDGPWVLAAVRLHPFQKHLFVFDIESRVFSPEGTDFVMGIGTSSLDLLNITIRRPSRLTLDLGTGCGVQALFAAAHSDRVIAIDSNPRAVEMAAHSAAMNEKSNIECRHGHLFEPVEGMKFDLIVANPPFVVSPKVRFTYRDAGADENICRRIVRQVPNFLEEGGFCEMICDWPEYAGRDWKEAMAEWFEGLGCNVWVKRTDRMDLPGYAARWLRTSERLSQEEQAYRFGEWMSFFEEQSIEAIGTGFLVMERTGRENTWFEADADPWKVTEPSGDSIENRFRMRGLLENMASEEELLDLRVEPSPNLLLDQRWIPSQEGWNSAGSKVCLSKGLRYEAEVDGSVARLITSCDGKKTLKDLLLTMTAPGDADGEAIKPAFLGLASRLIETGIIVPVS